MDQLAYAEAHRLHRWHPPAVYDRSGDLCAQPWGYDLDHGARIGEYRGAGETYTRLHLLPAGSQWWDLTEQAYLGFCCFLAAQVRLPKLCRQIGARIAGLIIDRRAINQQQVADAVGCCLRTVVTHCGTLRGLGVLLCFERFSIRRRKDGAGTRAWQITSRYRLTRSGAVPETATCTPPVADSCCLALAGSEIKSGAAVVMAADAVDNVDRGDNSAKAVDNLTLDEIVDGLEHLWGLLKPPDG